MIYLSQPQLALMLQALEKRSDWIKLKLRNPNTPDKPRLMAELSDILAVQSLFTTVEPKHSTVVLIQPKR